MSTGVGSISLLATSSLVSLTLLDWVATAIVLPAASIDVFSFDVCSQAGDIFKEKH